MSEVEPCRGGRPSSHMNPPASAFAETSFRINLDIYILSKVFLGRSGSTKSFEVFTTFTVKALPFASLSSVSTSFVSSNSPYRYQQRGLRKCESNNVTHHQCHRPQQHDTATRYSKEYQLFIIHRDTFPLPA